MAEQEKIVAKELQERPVEELKSLLASKTDALHKIKFKHALRQLEKTHELKSLRKDIARLNTVIASMQANKATEANAS